MQKQLLLATVCLLGKGAFAQAPYNTFPGITVDGGTGYPYTAMPNLAGDVQLQGDIQFLGANHWILHTLNNGTSLYLAPTIAPNQSFALATEFSNNGDVYFTHDVRIGLGNSTGGLLGRAGSMKLAVNGKLGATAVYVRAGVWPDYVFRPGYRLRPLAAVGRYVQQHHLPELPSAATVQAQGLDLGQMNGLLLKKVEELTLYLLALQQENQALQQRVSRLEK